jgi:hypothetical protein
VSLPPRLESARLAEFARTNTLSEISVLTSRMGSIVPGIYDFNFIFAKNQMSATLWRQARITVATVRWQVRLVGPFR